MGTVFDKVMPYRSLNVHYRVTEMVNGCLTACLCYGKCRLRYGTMQLSNLYPRIRHIYVSQLESLFTSFETLHYHVVVDIMSKTNIMMSFQIPKPNGSIPIRYWCDTFASDRCLIDIKTRGWATWYAAVLLCFNCNIFILIIIPSILCMCERVIEYCHCVMYILVTLSDVWLM